MLLGKLLYPTLAYSAKQGKATSGFFLYIPLKIIDKIQIVPPNWNEVITSNQPSIIRKILIK